MQARARMAIDTEEIIDQAVRLRSSREGVAPSQVVNDILRKALDAELAELSGELPLAALIQNVMRAGGKGSGTSP